MIKLRRLREWRDLLRYFIRKFIVAAGEVERTEDQIVDQLKAAIREPTCGVWFVMKGDVTMGYLFAQIMPTEYHTRCILIQQLYIETKMNFRLWRQMARALLAFGASCNATEMFFLTRRDPNAFIRLLNDGWEIDSFILRRRGKKVPCGTINRAISSN